VLDRSGEEDSRLVARLSGDHSSATENRQAETDLVLRFRGAAWMQSLEGHGVASWNDLTPAFARCRCTNQPESCRSTAAAQIVERVPGKRVCTAREPQGALAQSYIHAAVWDESG